MDAVAVGIAEVQAAMLEDIEGGQRLGW